jgi:hypothetical protein
MRKNLQEEITRINTIMGKLINEQVSDSPICDNNGCRGTYKGPEYSSQNGDIAHQYSNKISNAVGVKLKELYRSGTYVRVKFSGIKLSTVGMGSGNVVYTVNIPFESVSNKCDAMTGFGHVGGWGHTPELEKRKGEILGYIPSGKNENVVLDNELYVSNLTVTKEGLQEYWIQWKHRDFQGECGKQDLGGEPINITSSDLSGFLNDIKTKTMNMSVDLGSVKIDVDNLTLSINPGKTKILKMVLAISLENQPCESCVSMISKNSEYRPEKIGEGKFQNNTRIYNLIVLYPKQ